MWDWAGVLGTEPCFIVSVDPQEQEPAPPFPIAVISSVERLVQYAVNAVPNTVRVYLLEKTTEDDGRDAIHFPEVRGIGTYEGLPAGVPYYAHIDTMGVAKKTYQAQPPITDKTKINVLAVFG